MQRSLLSCWQWSLVLGFVVGISGCRIGLGPYQPGSFPNSSYKRGVEEPPEPIVGEPHRWMDETRAALDWPYRAFTRKPRPESYAPSERQQALLMQYLAENDLDDVQVEFHYYSPRHRWRRLRENQGVAPGWKYTVGLLPLMGYTIFPGRVFGHTAYDPYSNCLQVNNNRAYESLEEAAEAKVSHRLKYPGTFWSTVGVLPIVNVYPELLASGDIVAYARDREDWRLEKKALEGYYVDAALNASSIAFFDPSFVEGLLINLASGAVGEAAAITHIAYRQAERTRAGLDEDEEDVESVYDTDEPPNEFSHLIFGDRR